MDTSRRYDSDNKYVLFQAKIWNIRQCKLLFSLVGHNGCVFCVDLDDECKKAFTGSGDRVSLGT